MPIRAILFDAAGTLIHLPRGVGWHYREIAARHGIALEEKPLAAAFGAAFRAAAPRSSTRLSHREDPGSAEEEEGKNGGRRVGEHNLPMGPARVFSRVDPGSAKLPIAPAGTPRPATPSRPDDDKLWWRSLVRQVLAACGQEPAEAVFEAMFEELYAHFAQPGVWALYPEAAAVLDALHPRYKLGVVSNFDRRLYPVLEHLGVRRYFGTIVISSETGFDKPDGRIFSAALSALGTLPRETIHAGDSPEEDWRAAEAAGLHAYRVDRPVRGLEGLPQYACTL